MSSYTVYVEWRRGKYAGYVEEIDVEAESEAAARTLAEEQLRLIHEPGGKIVRIEPLVGVMIWSI